MNKETKDLVKLLVDKTPKFIKQACIEKAIINGEITKKAAIKELNSLYNE